MYTVCSYLSICCCFMLIVYLLWYYNYNKCFDWFVICCCCCCCCCVRRSYKRRDRKKLSSFSPNSVNSHHLWITWRWTSRNSMQAFNRCSQVSVCRESSCYQWLNLRLLSVCFYNVVVVFVVLFEVVRKHVNGLWLPNLREHPSESVRGQPITAHVRAQDRTQVAVVGSGDDDHCSNLTPRILFPCFRQMKRFLLRRPKT